MYLERLLVLFFVIKWTFPVVRSSKSLQDILSRVGAGEWLEECLKHKDKQLLLVCHGKMSVMLILHIKKS